MSAKVLAFPAPPDPAALCARPIRFAAPLARRRYTFAYMVSLLGLDLFAPRTQVDRLRVLVRKDGMPAPINPRQWGGKILRGADAVCATSLWDAAEVDAWVAGPGPVAPAAPTPLPPRQVNLREAMAARAAAMARAS